ncbi:MAG: hypothetical protein ACTTJ3_08650 [Treponema sp.]
MKKLILIFAVVLMLFISCKQSNFEESQGDYGTVIFDLTGGSNLRSIDSSTGLPKLADSKMKILVEANGQRVQTVEFSKEKAKQYKGTFLVGSKVKFTVIVMTKSGKWKGSSEITVASGTNNLSVKLKKAIAELEPLKFKLYTDETISSNHVRRFSLGFFDDDDKASPFFTEGGKDIEVSIDEYKEKIPSFCRDSKGRTYIFYKNSATGGDSKVILKRYTSEGEEDSSFSYSDDTNDKTNILVTADNKTGNVFVSYKENATPPQTKLFLVQEGNPAIPKDITPPSGSIGDVSVISVYNNVISTVRWDSGSGSGYKIKLYKYDGNAPISEIGEGTINQTLLSLKVEGAPSGKEYVPSGSFVDSFMNDKNIYLLCRNDDGSGYFASTGGIIKCDYTVQGATGTISEVKRLIAKNEYKADEHNIINVKEEDGAKEFYGPQRFVGFNEDVLYIADDGMVREYEAGQAQLLENKNRLVSFNLKSKDIRVKKENLETWLPESKAIAKTNPTLFFSYEKTPTGTFAKIKLHDESGFLHFENSTDEVLSIGKPHTDGLRYVVDSSGNFYVLHEDLGNPNKLEKYSPHKAGNSVVYERDYKFESINLKGLTGTNKITRLYYDHVKKDLYYYIDHSTMLYKLDGNNWRNINRGTYSLKKIMTIYDGRIWAYNKDGRKIESIGIDKNGVLENSETSQFSAPDEIKNNAVLGLSMYEGVLYFLYRDGSGSSFRTPVFALAINKDGNQKQVIGEALYTLEKDLKDIRPIGFDKETQELKFFRDVVNKDYDGRVSENINGYVAIKYDGNSLAKKEMDNPSDDIKWYAEEKVWQGATNAIMLWNKKSFTSPKTKFYALTKEELGKDPATLTPSFASNSTGTAYEVYDKFCYDQFGNLYVLIKRRNKYYVVRAKLTENNDYNLSYLGTVLNNDVSFDSSNAAFDVTYSDLSDTTLDKFIMAVYADSDASGVLYYSSIYGTSAIINKHHFTNDSFKRGSAEPFLSGIPTDNGTNLETRLIAIAANKDGVFIAQKELKYVKKDNDKYYESYNIEIRKYPHEAGPTTYNAPDATIDFVGKADKKVPTNMFDNYAPDNGLEKGKWDEYITENISDMYAYNGVLYALSYKRVGDEHYTSKDGVEPAFKTANVSGAMWKIWDNTKDATGGVTQVFERTSPNKTTSGSFSPKHFIAILPKKLVIASDDYYCWTDDSSHGHAKNYDSVFFFDVDNVSMDKDEVKVKAHFSFSYKEDQDTRPASSWEWG